jgi:hypothetical protein
MIAFSCPACDHLHEVGEDRVGTEATCVRCGQRVLVPSPTANQPRLGRPVRDADWQSQPPQPRVAAAAVKPHEDEGPKSPSPDYPYWMSDEAVEERLEARRRCWDRLLHRLAWFALAVPLLVTLLDVQMHGVAQPRKRRHA